MYASDQNYSTAVLGRVMETNGSYIIHVFSEWYFIVLNVVFVPPTIFGNMLILISLIRFPQLLRVRAYILIGNLAVSDLFVGLFVLPLDLSLTVSEYASSSLETCLLFYSLVFTFVGLSVMNLFILSLERFSAVVSPFQHNSRFTKKRIYIMILFTWITFIVIGFLPLFGLHETVPENFHCMSQHLLLPLYKWILLSLLMLSLIINTIFFIVIVRTATKKLRTLPGNLLTKNQLKKDIRHTRVMLTITGLFIIFWAPFGITAFIPGESETLFIVKDITASLGFINSCLNWVVYGYRCRKFREAFKSIIQCKCMKKDFKLPSSTIS